MVAGVKLRFDELLHQAPQPAPGSVDALVQTAASALTSAAGQPAVDPLLLQRASTSASYIAARIPKKGSIALNGYRSAATFELTFDFRDLPIDPRTVRAAAVEIHLDAVSDSDFATGMVRTTASGARASVLRPTQQNLIMVGYVDEWDVLDEELTEVTLRGRDMRAPLIDTQLGTAPGIQQQILSELDSSQPIDAVVTQLLRYNPLFAEFSVLVNPAEWPDGVVPAPRAATSIPRHRRGARGQRTGGRASLPGGSQTMSFWDLIVNLCYVVGAIPFFRGTQLVIRPARSIYDQSRAGFDPSTQTAFAGNARRKAPDGTTFAVRRLVYGRDVQKLQFTRKFGGFARPHTIRCVSLQSDAAGSRIIEARWPLATATDPQRANRVAPGGQQAQEEIDNIPIPGIHNVSQLQEIARNLYEQRARLEITGTATTRNLASFGGANNDPDLLRIQPGDAVEFYTDVRTLSSNQRQPLVSTVTDHYRTPFEAQVNEIASRLGDRALATAIVQTSRGQQAPVQRAFRVGNVKYDWSAEEGVSIDLDVQNYYELRIPQDSVGTTPGTVQTRSVPRGGT